MENNFKKLDSDRKKCNENEILKRNNENQDNDHQELEVSETKIYLEGENKNKLTKFPTGRIRTIIKTDTEISLINQEAVFLITKATELFIGTLVKESYKYTHLSKKKMVQKCDVQTAIDNIDSLVFLDGM